MLWGWWPGGCWLLGWLLVAPPVASRTPMGGVPGGNGAVAPNDVSHQAMRGWPGDFLYISVYSVNY